MQRPKPVPRKRNIWPAALCALCGVVLLAQVSGLPRAFAEESARRLPAPSVDDAAPGQLRNAVFAGGCFWGVQGVFQHVRGVKRAVSGYAGGSAGDANYKAVSNGRTRHAEAVQVTYDPAEISYGRLLQVFFSVALDPTQVDRQGPDSGPQYRSALFALDASQARVASAYIAKLDAERTYARPIATRVEGAATFHPAEGYHQDFLTRNPNHPYIVANDAPKVSALQRFFPEYYAPQPALVGAPPV